MQRLHKNLCKIIQLFPLLLNRHSRCCELGRNNSGFRKDHTRKAGRHNDLDMVLKMLNYVRDDAQELL